MAMVDESGSKQVRSRRTGRGWRRVRPVAEILEGRQLLAVITVNTTSDESGISAFPTLSLRQAIEISNGTLPVSSLNPEQASQVVGALSTPNTIDFQIMIVFPGVFPTSFEPPTIEPTTPLPAITSPVIIDGYSEPGAHANTNGPGQGKNTSIGIEIDGVNAPGANGLRIEAGQTTVEGLAIGGFSTGDGILIDSQSGDVIEGNFLGLDATGTTALPNATGIQDDNSGVLPIPQTNNTIGGTAAGAGNVISGNSGDGVALTGIGLSFGYSAKVLDLVQGNFIGTDVTGTKSLTNGGEGIDDGGGGSTIGGTVAGAGNLISGNAGDGLHTFGSFGDVDNFSIPSGSNDLVQGNFIGTDVTGTLPVPNGGSGINAYGGEVTIGGTAAGAGNVISGNRGDGVAIFGPTGAMNPNDAFVMGASDLVQGNLIGTDVGGAGPLPNGADGIGAQADGSSATIGGTAAGAGNIIAYNRGAGVHVFPPTVIPNSISDNYLISANSIFGNGALGINVSPVVPLIAPTPGLLSVTPSGSGSLITGAIDASSSYAVFPFTIEFFSSNAPDPSGIGQGRTYLGSTQVTTNDFGHASFTFSTPTALLGQYVTATTTLADNATSGFSSALLASTSTTPTTTTVSLLGPNRVATQGQPITFAASVTSTSGLVPTGQVAFLEDGVVLGSSPLDATGTASFVTDQLQPGPHVITAEYLGDTTHPATLSGAVAVQVFNALAFGGPAVTSDVFSGPNAATVTFNRGLFIGPAQDFTNYKIVGPRHQAITILSAVYNPSNASVTLTTAQALDPKKSYQLTINGQKGNRVVDVFGIALNGKTKGKPGHNYSGKIAVKKAPVVKVTPTSTAKPKVAKVHTTAHPKGR
jgi:hypothetical protein